MKTFLKARLRKSEEYWYRVAANITEYHIISKLIFLGIIIAKFMKIMQLFYVKNVSKNVKDQHV